MELRDYQEIMHDRVRYSISQGNRKILLQSPTGSGKTVTAAGIVQAAVEKGRRVTFLAHRRELIRQCSNKLEAFGIDHGVIMAGDPQQDWLGVQVVSVDTLRARAIQRERMMMPRTDILMIDEAHRSLSKTYMQIIESYPEAILIGLTATPTRGDGRGLGHIYDDLVLGPSIPWLVERGYLVPMRYFSPASPDLQGVRSKGGDYIQKDLAEAMDKEYLVGDIITQWFSLADNQQTVVFCSSVAHSIHIKERFQEAGVPAAHIDASTPTDERDAALRDLENGNIRVLSNCEVLTEGWDCPAAAVCVLARPTKSLRLYLQMIGRVMRPTDGKADGMVIDHAGAVPVHGFADEDFDWTLDQDGRMQADREARKRELKETVITCEQCFVAYMHRPTCPNCGHQNAKQGREVQVVDGELVEITRKERNKRKEWSTEDKQRWWSMLLGYAQEHGYKRGWAFHKYKEKFGIKPSTRFWDQPVTPDGEVSAYIRYMNIRYAKGKAKGEKAKEQARQRTLEYREKA